MVELRMDNTGGVGHGRAPAVADVECQVKLGSKVVEKVGQLPSRRAAAEHVEIGAYEHRVHSVLGQPRRQSAVQIADPTRRGRIE